MKIWIEADRRGENSKIGDSIFVVPFLNYWATKEGSVEYGPILNDWVSDSLPSHFILNSSLKKNDCDYILDTYEAWKYVVMHGKSAMHVINGFSYETGLNVALDLSFPFVRDALDINVDVVIAPFGSAYAARDGRVWQQTKWEQLLKTLPVDLSTVVIGSATDDCSWLPENVNKKLGKPLSYVAALLSKCKLFVSIDSGPANLANLIGVKNHVLLYPHNCPITGNWNAEEYKIAVSYKWPLVIDIPVEPVIEMCLKCLGDSNAR